MNAVFEKTQELGDALMQSDEYKAMKAAEDVAMKNAEAAALMTSYIEHKNQLDELTRVSRPDAAAIAEHTQAMADLQAQIQEIDDIAALSKARADFSRLIDQVNQVLRFIITGQVDDGGCGGNCSSCGGSCGAHEHDEDCDCCHDHE